MDRATLARAIQEVLPLRATRNSYELQIRRCDEYGGAETIAAELFRMDFERRFGTTAVFISQREYLETRQRSTPAIEFFLSMMREHFRNWVSPRNIRREGGFRKPDGMGIGMRAGQVQVELLEVKPYYHEGEGRQQIAEMIRLLRIGLQDFARHTVAPNGMRIEDFVMTPTSWCPRPEQMACPLFNPDATQELTWATYFAMRGPGATGGVALYELHSLPFGNAKSVLSSIPSAVQASMLAACDQFGWQRIGSSPAAWQQQFVQANPSVANALRSAAKAATWADVAAALALLFSGSPKGKAAGIGSGSQRTLLESARPLSVQLGPQTVVEPAIFEALVLAHFASN